MAGETSGDLLLRISADTTRAVEGVGNVGRQLNYLNESAGTLTRTFASGTPLMRGFFDAIGVLPKPLQETVGAIAALRFEWREFAALLGTAKSLTLGVATETGEWAHRTEAMSAALALSTTQLQAWHGAAAAFGLGAESADIAIRFFSRSLEQAAGGSMLSAREALHKLGLTAQQAMQFLADPSHGLEEVAIRLVKMGDSAERTAIAIALFGRYGETFIPTLVEIGKQGGNVAAAMKRFAVVLDPDLIASAARFGRQINILHEQQSAFFHTLGAVVATVLLPYATAWRERVGTALVQFEARAKAAIPAARELAAAIASTSGPIREAGAELAQWVAPLGRLTATIVPAANITSRTIGLFVSGFATALTVIRTGIEELVAFLRSNETPLLIKSLFGIKPEEAARQIDAAQAEQQAAINRTAAALTKLGETFSTFGRSERASATATEDAEEERRGSYTKTQALVDDMAQRRLHVEEENRIAVLEIIAAAMKRRHVLHQIDDETYLAEENRLKLGIIQIRKSTLEEIARLPTIAEDAKKLADTQLEIAKLNTEIAKTTAEGATVVAEAADKSKTKLTELTDKVAEAEERAFGTTTQAQVAKLVAEHDKFAAELAGHPDLIARIDVAYRRMIDDAMGATIDLSRTIKTGIEDAFSGVILGTRKMSDIFKAFKESLVKQFAEGFAEVLIKKAGFDMRLRLNAQTEWVQAGQEGALGFLQPLISGLDLIGGGTGGATLSFSPGGLASFVGGVPASFIAGALPVLETTPAQAAAVSRLAASGFSPAEIGALQAGALGGTPAGGAVAGGAVAGGGLGGLLATGASGLLLLSALSGGGGPQRLGSIGSLLALQGLAPGALGALLGPIAGIAGPLLNLLGLGGVVSGITTGLSAGAALGGLGGAGLAGGTALGTIGAALTPVLSYLPIIGGALMAAGGSLAATETLGAINALPFGASQLTGRKLEQVVNKAILQGALGKALGGIVYSIARPLFQDILEPVFTFFGLLPSLADVMKMFGLATTPMPRTSAYRIFRGFEQAPEFQKAIGAVAPDFLSKLVVPFGSKASDWFQMLPTVTTAAPVLEAKRPELRGLAELMLARAGPSPRGLYDIKIIEQFATAFITSADKAGISAKRFQAVIDTLVHGMAKDLSDAITLVNKAFINSALFTPDIRTGGYAEAITTVVHAFATDLPKAALDAIRVMAAAGKVTINQIQDYIESIKAATDTAKNAIQAAVEAVITAPDKIRQADYAIAQQKQSITLLDLEIDRAHRFGDSVGEAQLKIRKAEAEAVIASQQAARAALSPGRALLDAIKDGLRKSIVDAIVSGIVQGGLIQAALAPVFKAIKQLFDDLAAGAAPSQIRADMATIASTIRGAAPTVREGVAYATKITDMLGASSLLDLSDITIPGAVGKFRPRPLTVAPGGIHTIGPQRGAPAQVNLSLYVTGNQIMDDASIHRFARYVGETMLRMVKQNIRVG